MPRDRSDLKLPGYRNDQPGHGGIEKAQRGPFWDEVLDGKRRKMVRIHCMRCHQHWHIPMLPKHVSKDEDAMQQTVVEDAKRGEFSPYSCKTCLGLEQTVEVYTPPRPKDHGKETI